MKKVTIEISSDELDSFEDYLMLDHDVVKREKYRNVCLDIWSRLVKEFDKEKEKNIVTVYVDKSCEMAEVQLNGECVMAGNYWDFHPGCHGIYRYGEWNCYNGLAGNIAHCVGNCEIVHKTYNFEINKYEP